jgi:hypothetical protein
VPFPARPNKIALSDCGGGTQRAVRDTRGNAGTAQQGTTVERRKQWSFPIGEDGSWTWRVVTPEGDESTSARTFKTLRECTEDAKRNGYVAWKSDDERRRFA